MISYQIKKTKDGVGGEYRIIQWIAGSILDLSKY